MREGGVRECEGQGGERCEGVAAVQCGAIILPPHTSLKPSSYVRVQRERMVRRDAVAAHIEHHRGLVVLTRCAVGRIAHRKKRLVQFRRAVVRDVALEDVEVTERLGVGERPGK